jgi:hypothetical protein
MKIEDKKLRNYFLENLSPAEIEEIDLQLISDVELAAELDAAETGLLEDYLENSLSVEETELFERKFLVTEERRKRLELVGALKQFAATATAPPLDLKSKAPGFFESLTTLLSPRSLALGAGVIVLILVVGLVWTMYRPTGGLDSEVAALNQTDLADPGRFKDSTNLALAPGSLRSGGNENSFEAEKLTGNVFFRLALTPQSSPDPVYRVKLLREQKIVFTLDKVRIYQNTAGPELRLLVPSRLLTNGEYRLELEQGAAKTIFNFTIR